MKTNIHFWSYLA